MRLPTLLLLLLALPVALPTTVAGQPSQLDTLAPAQDKLAEYETKREAAGKNIDDLWDLYLWCDAYALDKQGRSCLRAILRVDKGHRPAHKALGHLEMDGKWFTTKKKLEKYKAAEELRIAKEKGLVKYKGEWVSKEDEAKLKRGLTLDEDGIWVSREVLEKQKAGWVQQDTTWIPPQEQPNIEKGLWKCGDSWLPLEEANAYHSELGHWWVIPTEWFTIYTTLDREVVALAQDHMERAYRDVQRALGKTPAAPVPVMIARNVEQYRAFAAGDGSGSATELVGMSAIHWGFFADSWFVGEPRELLASGVGYWDASTEGGSRFGVHSVRHAAALSLLEALDPSQAALEKGRKSGFERWDGEDFWSEKKFPTWFRFGIASYVGRYFVDQFSSAEKHNWAREWSVQNLLSKGGLRPLAEAFETEFSVDRMESSIKLMNELGAIMSFALDGKNAEVSAAYSALRQAIREDQDPAPAFENLRKALTENEDALREFAGL